jgi:DnaJ-class molecular chaperone
VSNTDLIDMLNHLAERSTSNCTDCLGTGIVRCDQCDGRGWFGWSEWTIESYCEDCNRSGSIRCKTC